MEKSTKDKSKVSSSVVLGALLISIGVGFVTFVMLAFLFITVVGGGEWGPTLAIFGAPLLAVIMTAGSLFVMAIHAILFFRRKQQAAIVYLGIWVIGWVFGLAILVIPFLYALVVDGYHWPENSLLFTIPLALLAGLLFGTGVNGITGKRLNAK